MSDDRQPFTHDLVSAKYLNSEQVDAEAVQIKPAVRRAPPSQSGLEQAMRWISPIVGVLVLAVVGGWFWQNHAALSSSVGKIRERTSNPVDLALWIGGSQHTAKDIIVEAQRNSEAEFEKLKSTPFQSDFEGVDLDFLSQPGNPQR